MPGRRQNIDMNLQNTESGSLHVAVRSTKLQMGGSAGRVTVHSTCSGGRHKLCQAKATQWAGVMPAQVRQEWNNQPSRSRRTAGNQKKNEHSFPHHATSYCPTAPAVQTSVVDPNVPTVPAEPGMRPGRDNGMNANVVCKYVACYAYA